MTEKNGRGTSDGHRTWEKVEWNKQNTIWCAWRADLKRNKQTNTSQHNTEREGLGHGRRGTKHITTHDTKRDGMVRDGEKQTNTSRLAAQGNRNIQGPHMRMKMNSFCHNQTMSPPRILLSTVL